MGSGSALSWTVSAQVLAVAAMSASAHAALSAGPLKYRADWRSVLVMAAFTGTFVVQWFVLESWNPFWFALSLILGVQVVNIAHSHNHLPIWRYRWLNVLTDYWATFSYGLPKLTWQAIHNRSHHVHHNGPGDGTSTHHMGDKNNVWGFLLYAPSCIPAFWPLHGSALAKLYREDRRAFAYHVSHILFLWGSMGAAFVLDWQKALLYLVVPQQVAVTAATVFNFVQHAHTDADSEYNVARNFTSPILNFYLFNIGFHTIHHRKPTLHWSLAPAAQARIADQIDPSLNEKSFWAYLGRVYFLSPFVPGLRSKPLVLQTASAADEKEPLTHEVPKLSCSVSTKGRTHENFT